MLDLKDTENVLPDQKIMLVDTQVSDIYRTADRELQEVARAMQEKSGAKVGISSLYNMEYFVDKKKISLHLFCSSKNDLFNMLHQGEPVLLKDVYMEYRNYANKIEMDSIGLNVFRAHFAEVWEAKWNGKITYRKFKTSVFSVIFKKQLDNTPTQHLS